MVSHELSAADMRMSWPEVAEVAVREHGALQKPPELAGLLELLAEEPPHAILEIGSHEGGTLWAWHQVAPDAHIVSLDIDHGPLRAECLEYVTPVTGDSQRWDAPGAVRLALNGRRTVDFVFIDGNHSYSAVRHDWVAFLPLVRPGGLVAFHDIAYTDADYGVQQLWREVRRYWPPADMREFVHLDAPDPVFPGRDTSAGIGVVRV